MNYNLKENNMHKVAVYGSLLTGLGNHGMLAKSKLLGVTKVNISFQMLDLGAFPGLIPSEENSSITIEVYEVDDFTFSRLDGLEGYPRFYDRLTIETEFGDAWIYYLATPEHYGERLVIETGDWKKHYENRWSKILS